MIEIIAPIARWFQLTANMGLLGGCVFLAIAGSDKNALLSPWVIRLERALPWLATVLFLGLLVILATSAAQATGVAEHALQPATWLAFVEKTLTGKLWLWRAGFALVVLGTAIYVRNSPRVQWRYMLCAVAAVFPLATIALGSHSAAEEMSLESVLPYMLHIVLAGIWFGALPAFLLMLFTKQKQSSGEAVDKSGIETLNRFSVMALPVMLGIIATGLFIANRTVESSYGALVASEYGWILNAKIALLAMVLVIAMQARSTWLPMLAQGSDMAVIGGKKLRKWVRIEFFLASMIVLLATILANTLPAKHAIIDEWPYLFRFSIDATWGDPVVVMQVWGGVTLFALVGVVIAYGRARQWTTKRLVGISVVLVPCALAVTLPPLAVQAYPETYRRTPVPFDSISIANGSYFYADNCVGCHGFQGKGDGVLAKNFDKPPVDLLTEAHTAKHTAGDFFNWLTKGIPGTGMPGFTNNLDEEERWDVVNYIHAISRGYQSRILNSQVDPNRPVATFAPPSFPYAAHDGSSGILQDFRQEKAVLLVLFSWPASQERLDQLRLAYASLAEENAVVLAVPIHDLEPQTMKEVTAKVPFPVVIQGAPEITRSYALYRRTLRNADLLGEGSLPQHMEFLVDRYGYLRARWIPEVEAGGWGKMDALMQQVAQLNREEEILPPPDDHVH